MARSGSGLCRLQPHSLGEWTRCHGCPLSHEPNTACTGWWWWSSRSAWTAKVQLCMFYRVISFGWPLRQIAQIYAGSLALLAFSLTVGPRCRPVSGRHCSEYCTVTVATGLGTHKEKKVWVDIHVQAARSQICLHNMCGQQRNSPMADPIFGSKYGPQNGVQNWITFSFLLLGLCLGPVLGSRFGPKSGGQPSENFAAARRGFASRFATH